VVEGLIRDLRRQRSPSKVVEERLRRLSSERRRPSFVEWAGERTSKRVWVRFWKQVCE
jgi:hypothetical protein